MRALRGRSIPYDDQRAAGLHGCMQQVWPFCCCCGPRCKSAPACPSEGQCSVMDLQVLQLPLDLKLIFR